MVAMYTMGGNGKNKEYQMHPRDSLLLSQQTCSVFGYGRRGEERNKVDPQNCKMRIGEKIYAGQKRIEKNM